MALKLYNFDPAEFLDSEEDIAAYIADIAEDKNPALLASALGDVARARNMSQLARDAGMTRAGLIKALSRDGNPSLATIAKVAKALGLKISLTPVKKAKAAAKPAKTPKSRAA